MFKTIKNAFFQVKSILGIVNMTNIRNFFFNLKQESLSSTASKIIDIYKNRKILNHQAITIKDKNESKHTLHYGIDRVFRFEEKLLVYCWFSGFDSPIHITCKSSEKTLECRYINFRRPEVLREFKFIDIEECGYLLSLKSNMVNNDLQIIIQLEDHIYFSIPVEITTELSNSDPDDDLNYWIRYLYKTKLLPTKPCQISKGPLISVVTPIYNAKPEHLNELVESLINQNYAFWELCLYDDGSDNTSTLNCLDKINGMDQRIRIEKDENKGMVVAYNKAVSMASGEWIVFLDHDDKLDSYALCELAELVSEKPKLKMVYSDEDIVDMDGMHKRPSSKGAFDLKKLEKSNYINHMTAVNKALGDKLGWFKKDYEGAQDYDLLLRIAETVENSEIAYIGKILYHWRQGVNSINLRYFDKQYVIQAGMRALEDHYNRMGRNGKVKAGKKVGTYRIVEE